MTVGVHCPTNSHPTTQPLSRPILGYTRSRDPHREVIFDYGYNPEMEDGILVARYKPQSGKRSDHQHRKVTYICFHHSPMDVRPGLQLNLHSCPLPHRYPYLRPLQGHRPAYMLRRATPALHDQVPNLSYKHQTYANTFQPARYPALLDSKKYRRG